jgi:predicted RecA/RadA family phage recombinase
MMIAFQGVKKADAGNFAAEGLAELPGAVHQGLFIDDVQRGAVPAMDIQKGLFSIQEGTNKCCQFLLV